LNSLIFFFSIALERVFPIVLDLKIPKNFRGLEKEKEKSNLKKKEFWL